MKKSLFISCMLSALCFAVGVSADDRVSVIVERLAAAVKSLGSYEAAFTVRVGEYSGDGRYAVSGRGYNLSLGDVEVFCDGAVRREVNRALREITVDNVDTAARNILSDPVGAFDFIGDDFSAELVSENDGTAVVSLTPKSGGIHGGVIEVTVDVRTFYPQRLVYRLDGDAVTVDVRKLASSSVPLKTFDPKSFDGYEIIDFR